MPGTGLNTFTCMVLLNLHQDPGKHITCVTSHTGNDSSSLQTIITAVLGQGADAKSELCGTMSCAPPTAI